MNNALEHPINPIFSNFDKQIKDLNEKDKNYVDFDLYMQESTLLQYCTDNEHAFYKNTNVAFPEEIARQIERKNCIRKCVEKLYSTILFFYIYRTP